MINSKNYIVVIKVFLFIQTFVFLFSCANKKNYVTKITAQKIEVNNSSIENDSIIAFIAPFKQKIESEMEVPLSLLEETLDKKGEWQTNIGNWMASACLEMGNEIFEKRTQKKIDGVILNNGGIRAILPKGLVKVKNIFEIMPFENQLVVVAIKGEALYSFANYLIEEKKPHPISGFTLFYDKEKKCSKITINETLINKDELYYIATSDYLLNGGDNMTFFQNNKEVVTLDYKIRNVLIDYCKRYKSLPIFIDKRIFFE